MRTVTTVGLPSTDTQPPAEQQETNGNSANAKSNPRTITDYFVTSYPQQLLLLSSTTSCQKVFLISVFEIQNSIQRKAHICVWISAPEMMSGGGYSQWCDVWSIGVVMYML